MCVLTIEIASSFLQLSSSPPKSPSLQRNNPYELPSVGPSLFLFHTKIYLLVPMFMNIQMYIHNIFY